MPIFDLFSKRQKKLRGDVPDVYSYGALPEPLKVQIVHIILGSLGNTGDYHGLSYEHTQVVHAYKSIVEALCREYGRFRLPGTDNTYGERAYLDELVNFFLQEKT